jgi:polygalacturonase
MKKICLLTFMIGTLVTAFSQKKDYVITTYGARPDGVTNNVAAIQRAIDDASSAEEGEC